MDDSASRVVSRRFSGICDVCLEDVPGEVIREGELVYNKRVCGKHGERRLLMSRNGDRYVRLDAAYHRLFPGDAPPSATTDTCFFVTNRCNQSCSYCAMEANRYSYFDDMSVVDFRNALAGCRGTKVSLIGGEPIQHPRFFELVGEVARSGRTLVVYTNGLALADARLVARLVAAAPRLEIRMTFEGFIEEGYAHLPGRTLRSRKIAALDNLRRHRVPTVLGSTMLTSADPAVTRRALRSVIEYAMDQDFVRGLTFQSAVALGASRTLGAEDMLSVDGVVDRVVEALPVAVPRDVAYPAQKLFCVAARLFRLPSCAYVQVVPLFWTRAGWVSLDHFFDLERLDRELDRAIERGPTTPIAIAGEVARACLASLRPRRSPALVPLALGLLPAFLKGYDFDSIPRSVLPLVSISVCDRHNLDRDVSRRCEKSVYSSVRGHMVHELCSEMVTRHLHERVQGDRLRSGS